MLHIYYSVGVFDFYFDFELHQFINTDVHVGLTPMIFPANFEVLLTKKLNKREENVNEREKILIQGQPQDSFTFKSQGLINEFLQLITVELERIEI